MFRARQKWKQISGEFLIIRFWNIQIAKKWILY